jgi:hypothetical protein
LADIADNGAYDLKPALGNAGVFGGEGDGVNRDIRVADDLAENLPRASG